MKCHGKDVEMGPFLKGQTADAPSMGSKRWNRFLRQNLNVPPITIENMRHSFATSFLAAAGNVGNLSRVLGHTSINTTYRQQVRPTADNLEADMSRVDLAL